MVAVAAKQNPEQVSFVPFPVAWNLGSSYRRWKSTRLFHTLQCEETAPRFVVLADDLLGRSGADSCDILLVDLRVPVELQIALILSAVQVVDLVPGDHYDDDGSDDG